MQTVAIIGAGPAGLCAARYLKSEGLESVIFERGDSMGGQWSGHASRSGVWPSMRTNTSRIMSSFSDLPHPPGTPSYPTNQAMKNYLERYAETFDLASRIRFESPVLSLRSDGDAGWIIRTENREESFRYVVVASGRYNFPSIPDVPGLASFSGLGGVKHTFSYKQPEDYRGLRVLVTGCSISSLEIAGDLAMLGAARVVLSSRKQRYVLPKLVSGVPLDHVAFTRFAALAEESFPPAAVGAGLKQFVLNANGSPEQYGALRPPDDIFEANITQSQYFLPLVAEGRIGVKPWIDAVDQTAVRFADGSVESFDAIVSGTGYDLHLPFLSEQIRTTLNADAHHLDLFKLTFHPDLRGLAFLGVFELIGPYYPVLELQARWIAYTFSGAQDAPSKEDAEAGIAAYQARRGLPQALRFHAACLLFSRAAKVEPELDRFPELARALLFGPLTPMSFRMTGRDSLRDAPERFAAEVLAFGCMPTSKFDPSQAAQLQALANARRDEAFSRYVAAVVSRENRPVLNAVNV